MLLKGKKKETGKLDAKLKKNRTVSLLEMQNGAMQE